MFCVTGIDKRVMKIAGWGFTYGKSDLLQPRGLSLAQRLGVVRSPQDPSDILREDPAEAKEPGDK
jgi:hypothetical protein